MHGATYRSAIEANSVMAGGGVAEVVASKTPGLAPGDLVWGDTGWQDYAAIAGKNLTKLPRMEPITHLLSVYGVAGLTAPHQAGQHQVPRRQVAAGIGQVGGVYVPDGPVQARDIGQQPEAQIRHVEQFPEPHGITSPR